MKLQQYKRYRKVKPEINMTSMIDVMSILMSVFMITAPMLTTGINVDLPTGGKSTLTKANKAIDIAITKDGKIFIGDSEVQKQNLKNKISSMLKANPNLTIVVSGDTNTSYGKIIEVMAELKTAGFKNIGLKTSPYKNEK